MVATFNNKLFFLPYEQPFNYSPMWYVQSSVDSTLHCSKHPCPSRCPCKAHIEITPEGTWLTVHGLHVILVTGHILTATVDSIQVQLLQQLNQHMLIHSCCDEKKNYFIYFFQIT